MVFVKNIIEGLFTDSSHGLLCEAEHGVALLLLVRDASPQLPLHGSRARNCHAVGPTLQGHLHIVLGPQQITMRVPTPESQSLNVFHHYNHVYNNVFQDAALHVSN